MSITHRSQECYNELDTFQIVIIIIVDIIIIYVAETQYNSEKHETTGHSTEMLIHADECCPKLLTLSIFKVKYIVNVITQ